MYDPYVYHSLATCERHVKQPVENTGCASGRRLGMLALIKRGAFAPVFVITPTPLDTFTTVCTCPKVSSADA